MLSAEWPERDIQFSPADRDEFLRELANTFSTESAMVRFLASLGFPRRLVPMFHGSAEETWSLILADIDRGAMAAGYYRLLSAALRAYRYNQVFLRLAETYLPAPADDRDPATAARTHKSANWLPRPGEPVHDLSLPAQDIRFSPADRAEFRAALVSCFNTEERLFSVLRDLGFPPGRIPVFRGSAAEMWGDLLAEIDRGVIQAGNYSLLSVAYRAYRRNFERLAETYLGGAADSVGLSDGDRPRLGLQPQPRLTGHAFISYVHEDSPEVDRLQRILEASGVRVWRDTADLWPGEDWRAKIRHAITDDALVFLACFSREGVAREKSYQNEELLLAIEQMRLRRPDEPWLIPIRFDDCDIPDFELGGGRSLSSIQRADLFGDRFDAGAARLTTAVLRILGR
jgi:hypothetical protein